jgi:1-acyl-sn-glycerol-3-phosphate acyltransferase
MQSGFVPKCLAGVQLLTRPIARIWVFIQLGKLRIINAQNLKLDGRFIYCPNHSSLLDAAVMHAIMRQRGFRYMAAFEEMRGVWGLKAIIMGAVGCFPVDRSRGSTAIEPATIILADGSCLVIFPEGRISHSGVCLPFKMGPAVIAQRAYKQLGGKEPIGIVPVYINYHSRDVATATAGFLRMGLKWRGGVTVTVGDPLMIADFPTDDPAPIMRAAHAFVCQHEALAACACKA